MLTNSAPSTQRQPSTFRIRQSNAHARRRHAADHLREQVATLEEALREAWRVFDLLGAYQSDDDKLAVLSGHAFRRRRTGFARRCLRFSGRRMRHPATMPGAGDECTWPAFAMLPCDPRSPATSDELSDAMDVQRTPSLVARR